MKKFTNEERYRKYGKRVGDIVTSDSYGNNFKAEVISIEFGDNNRVLVLDSNGNQRECVAEWLDIETKVEDRNDYKEILPFGDYLYLNTI